jgi:phosphoenolpyruvate synthase/pyruvate phosphate dikinase
MAYICKMTENVSIENVGAKAANLFRLHKFGYKVPCTFFVSVTCLHDFLTLNHIGPVLQKVDSAIQARAGLADCKKAAFELRKAIINADMPEELVNEIRKKIIPEFNARNVKVAIRSSSINEDLEQNSFAGQYASELNVQLSVAAIEKNIKSVWASQWSEPIIAYTFKQSLPAPEPGMGVVIQEMVPAEIAGVLFSHNPYNFNKNEMIVEYVEGLGEALVSGEKTPVHLVFNRKLQSFKNASTLIKKHYTNALSILVYAAEELERKTGLAVDLEWAMADGELYLLQLRSITTLSQQSVLWTDENVGEVIPDIVTPFSWSILGPITNNAFKGFLKGLAIKDYPEEGLFGLFKGKVYFNSTSFNETLQRFYLTTYLKDVKEKGGNKIVKILQLARLPFKLLFALLSFFRFAHKLPAQIDDHFPHHKKTLSINLYGKKLGKKQSYLCAQQIINLHLQTMFLHVSDTILAELFYQFLNKVCNGLKSSTVSADQLLSGLDSAESAKSGFALWRLSKFVKARGLVDVFDMTDACEIEEKLSQSEKGKEVLSQIRVFIGQFGHGALHEFELLYPRWWEDRAYIYSNIKSYLKNDSIDLSRHKGALHKKRNLLLEKLQKELFGPKKWLFNYLYKKAVYFSTQRENLKQAFIKAHSELKKHLLNIGRLLKEEGLFSKNDDILFLENQEIQKYVDNKLQIKDIKSVISARRARRAKFSLESHPPKIMQIGETWRPVYEEDNGEADLSGIGCSSGIVEGTAKIILDADQFDDLQEGDILVTRSTNPGWTPLFVTAAAVVTEIGGALSHGAIIAREYGIPMIAAVKDATKQISSGDTIRVNGDNGTIQILQENGVNN